MLISPQRNDDVSCAIVPEMTRRSNGREPSSWYWTCSSICNGSKKIRTSDGRTFGSGSTNCPFVVLSHSLLAIQTMSYSELLFVGSFPKNTHSSSVSSMFPTCFLDLSYKSKYTQHHYCCVRSDVFCSPNVAGASPRDSRDAPFFDRCGGSIGPSDVRRSLKWRCWKMNQKPWIHLEKHILKIYKHPLL